MTAYYNEIEPFAVAWLKNLIAKGHIAPGDVDDRSIEDVKPDDLKGYTQCHFFAGIGGWSLALRKAGWPDDVPVWTGSCPCQPFSAAGKGKGFADERHLWPHWFHLISQSRPSIVFGEQVASKDGLGWIDLVQTDLEASAYAFGTADICAAGVGAPHIRQRLWFVGVADGIFPRLEGYRWNGSDGHESGRLDPVTTGSTSESCGISNANPTKNFWKDADWLHCRDKKWRPIEPGSFPLAHGIPARVGRLRAYGNAIVPQVASTFIKGVIECLE